MGLGSMGEGSGVGMIRISDGICNLPLIFNPTHTGEKRDNAGGTVS